MKLNNITPTYLNIANNQLMKAKILIFRGLNFDSFPKCPNLSIDFAVMEKTSNGIGFTFRC